MLTHNQDHREIFGKEYRDITETILMPVANVEPELGSWSAHQVTPGAPATPPAAPNRNTQTTDTMNRADAKGSPVTPVAPAPVQTTVPNTRRRPDPTTAQATPPGGATSPQVEFAQHYSAVMGRAARVRAGLAQWQRSHGGASALPDDVKAAKARMEDQFQAVVNSMRARDTLAADQGLNEVGATLTVIEQFLAKQEAPAR